MTIRLSFIQYQKEIVVRIVFNGTINEQNPPEFTENPIVFYHNDHLGSTAAITNESGDLIEETFYAPFAEILSGGENSRYDYEGKEYSDVTQDYDYDFRKYDPVLGIFTQPEQIFPNLFDPQQLNRYSFERNNPYSFVDQDGNSIFPSSRERYNIESYSQGVGDFLSGFGLAISQLWSTVPGATIIENIVRTNYGETTYNVVSWGGIEYYNALYGGTQLGDILAPEKELDRRRNVAAYSVTLELLDTLIGKSYSRYRTYNKIFGAATGESISSNVISSVSDYYYSYQNTPTIYNIDQAQNSGGCNSDLQSCLPDQPSSSSGGGPRSSPNNNNNDINTGGGPVCGGCNPDLQCCL